MTTVTLWLLVNLGSGSVSGYSQPTVVVERFTTVQECERVRGVIQGSDGYYAGSNRLRCIQATVARP